MGKNILDEVLAGRYSPGRELLQKVERLDQTRIWQKKIALSERERLVTLSATNEGTGRGFIGEPNRTLCSELRGNDTIIPSEAWAISGEDSETEVTGEGIFDCDSDRDPRDPENHHVELENFTEEDIYPDRYDFSEDEREMGRDPEWDPNRVAQAGVNLMVELGLSRTREMCDVVGVYLEHRMDGVISRYFRHVSDSESKIAEAVLEFAGKMREHQPEISDAWLKKLIREAKLENLSATRKSHIVDVRRLEISAEAKARLIKRAQIERSGNGNGPAYRLGEAIFGNRWNRLLIATV